MIDIQKQGIITLVKNALKNEKNALPQGFNLEEAIPVAKSHQIIPMLYYGALASGMDSNAALGDLFKYVCLFIAKDSKQSYTLQKLMDAFDKNGIEYMPLKGTVLKSMYPKSDMRIMGDADILIKTEQYEQIKPVLIELGFEEAVESDHELSWKSKTLFLELHKRIIPSYNKDYYAYFGDGWQLARKKETQGSRYEMSPEDTLIYLFTHFAKHYRDGGIGIRHVTDIWVYFNKNKNLDNKYIKTELEKLQLWEFYQNVLDTINVWFDDKEPTGKTDFITDVIFSSGAYGTKEGHLVASAVKLMDNTDDMNKARFKKALRILFPKYKNMTSRYPVLLKAPILLPLFWIVRGFETIFFNSQKIKSNKAKMDVITNDKMTDYQKSLHFVGLDFNFKE